MRHCRGRGSIPHQGPKIPHGARPGQTNNNNKNQPNSHAISLPLLFLSKETKPFLCFPWQQNSSKGTSMLPVYKSPPLFLLSNQIMKIFSPTTPIGPLLPRPPKCPHEKSRNQSPSSCPISRIVTAQLSSSQHPLFSWLPEPHTLLVVSLPHQQAAPSPSFSTSV